MFLVHPIFFIGFFGRLSKVPSYSKASCLSVVLLLGDRDSSSSCRSGHRNSPHRSAVISDECINGGMWGKTVFEAPPTHILPVLKNFTFSLIARLLLSIKYSIPRKRFYLFIMATCEACNTIPPVVAEGYTLKGSYIELGGLNTCTSLSSILALPPLTPKNNKIK